MRVNLIRRAVRRFWAWGRNLNDPAQAIGRFYAYLGPDLAMTRLTDGHFIYVDPTDEQIASHLIARGYWESWIDAAVGRMVGPGDHVIEVGANLGYYTLKMARAIGPHGRLETFEASPYLAGLVARSVAFNGYDARVRVHAMAACDRGGELQFSLSRRLGGSGHIAGDTEVDGGPRNVITVPCVRLDDVIATDRPVSLLRMDAEGAEPLVLEGMEALLARSPDIRICMEWATEMMAARRSVADMIRRLRSEGFRFWLIAPDGSLPELSDEALLALSLNDVVIARAHPYR